MIEQSQNLFSHRRVSLIKYSGQSINAKTGWKIKLDGIETGLSIDQSVIYGLKKSSAGNALITNSAYLEATVKNITRALVKYGVELVPPEQKNLKKLLLSLI